MFNRNFKACDRPPRQLSLWQDSLHTAQYSEADFWVWPKDTACTSNSVAATMPANFTADSILRKRFPDLARRIDQAMPALATDADAIAWSAISRNVTTQSRRNEMTQ